MSIKCPDIKCISVEKNSYSLYNIFVAILHFAILSATTQALSIVSIKTYRSYNNHNG